MAPIDANKRSIFGLSLGSNQIVNVRGKTPTPKHGAQLHREFTDVLILNGVNVPRKVVRYSTQGPFSCCLINFDMPVTTATRTLVVIEIGKPFGSNFLLRPSIHMLLTCGAWNSSKTPLL